MTVRVVIGVALFFLAVACTLYDVLEAIVKSPRGALLHWFEPVLCAVLWAAWYVVMR